MIIVILLNKFLLIFWRKNIFLSLSTSSSFLQPITFVYTNHFLPSFLPPILLLFTIIFLSFQLLTSGFRSLWTMPFLCM